MPDCFAGRDVSGERQGGARALALARQTGDGTVVAVAHADLLYWADLVGQPVGSARSGRLLHSETTAERTSRCGSCWLGGFQ